MDRLLAPALAGLMLCLLQSCGASAPTARTARGKASQRNMPTVEVGGARLVLDFRGRTVDRRQRARLVRWVERSAEMVSEYYGRFPVPSLRVELMLNGGASVGFGQHFDGRLVRVRVGREVPDATLERDWVMVHEMLHAAFPDVPDRHRWAKEGLSTYLQGVCRVRAGIFREEEVWRNWTEAMRWGLPGRRDRGLDRTRSWGRTYWGGAIFWLSVDVELRRRTGGRHTLQTALRGVLGAGGNARAEWSMDRVVREADRATGTRVVRQGYRAMALAPGARDLDALFGSLGVERVGRQVRLRDDAPEAAIRRALMR
ncbi:MAG: hypothetical protein RLP09_20895 [Sandaracinaceae bacterium]